MSLAEKHAVGVEIVQPLPTATAPHQLTIGRGSEDAKSSLTLTHTQCPSPDDEYDPSSTHPFSAFYCHPTTRTSFEQLKTESNVRINVYEADLEAGHSRKSLDPSRRSKECSMKGGRDALKKKSSLLMRDRSGWNPMRKLNKRQKLWAKLLIALLIVGAAVGLGIGISKAVGGGVWKSANDQAPIGPS